MRKVISFMVLLLAAAVSYIRKVMQPCPSNQSSNMNTDAAPQMGSKAAPTFDPKGAADVVSAEFEAHVRAAHASEDTKSEKSDLLYDVLEDAIEKHKKGMTTYQIMGTLMSLLLRFWERYTYCVASGLQPSGVTAQQKNRARQERSASAPVRDELIDNIVGDLVRETNIFPNQVERAKQILRKRLMVKKKVMDAGLKKVEK